MEFAFKLEWVEGGLQLDSTASITIAGTYSLSDSDYTLTIEDGDASSFGSFESATVTGTWSREGNTLTLNNDDGSTMVFKKK